MNEYEFVIILFSLVLIFNLIIYRMRLKEEKKEDTPPSQKEKPSSYLWKVTKTYR